MSYRERVEGLISRTRSVEKRAELEAELSLPNYPMELDYLWQAFRRLRRRISGSAFGIAAISWADISAFVGLTGQRLLPWEILVIEDLDDAYIEAMSQQSEAD